jgi:DNA-binding CsgD family transcriptional regulator
MFVLYLLAYTIGIGAITAGLFLYFSGKIKSAILKYYLLANLFNTIVMLFYTLLYYGDLARLREYQWFGIFSIYGLLFFYMQTGHFLSLTVNKLVEYSLCKKEKICYIIVLICCFLAIVLMDVLNKEEIVHINCIFSADLFVLDIYCTIIILYNITVLWKGRSKLGSDIKSMVYGVIGACILFLLLSLLSDIFKINIGYLPGLYFTTNLIAVYFFIKYYFSKKNDDTSQPTTVYAVLQYSCESFCTNYGITERELEIMRLIAAGKSNQDIGDELYISANTVRNHIYHIYKKLGIKSRYELINLLSDLKIFVGARNGCV